MTRCSIHSTPLMRSLLLALLACLGGLAQSGLQAGDVQTVDKQGVTTVTCDGKLVLEYRSQAHPMKVYVSQWTTPQGTQVLRDSPHDHVHHRALMYALGIDDCDFWSEEPADQYGKQVPADGTSLSSTSTNGRLRTVIRQAINWINTKDIVLAVESREITAEQGVLEGASLLTWQTTLTPTEEKPEVELWGRHYFGLGMRFVESMDKGARFVTSGDDLGTVVRGSEKLTRATWCAIHAQADGEPVTIAMFDHPDNPRHPATWFTMNDPFAYITATLDLEREKMTISRDKPLRVKYGVAAWDGDTDKAVIEQAYQSWLNNNAQ